MNLVDPAPILVELSDINTDLNTAIEASGPDSPDATALGEKLAALRVQLGASADPADPSLRIPFKKSGFKKFEKQTLFAYKKAMKNGTPDQTGEGKGKGKGKEAAEEELSADQVKKRDAKQERKRERFEARNDYENVTVPGERKDVSGEMAQHYNPKATEAAWYEWWNKKGFFEADEADSDNPCGTYVMVIPPPNVTGSLHLGHALTNSIQDALIRWQRMQGKNTLWVPGMDHAGIATQMVVEKKLASQGIRAKEIGREKFIERVWEWKEDFGGKIAKQLRRLGSSLDWRREVFTMDEHMSRAVVEAVVRFDEDGIVFREHRLVNWDCTLQTAISDVEVEHIDLAGRTELCVPGHGDRKFEMGVMHHFLYQVADNEGKPTQETVEIATTRLETMLGDTAVAIHPEDPRHKHLHGKQVVHPFDGRLLPIILDSILVDMELGTGCVKITPAHDPNDFECGKRNGLEFRNILENDGRLNEKVPEPFAGMMRIDARFKVLEALREKGLFVDTKDHAMAIAISSRTKDIIEPVVKPQWWVDCKSMAKRAIEQVDTGKIKILPASPHIETWRRWLGEENIRPWCISRQLWWGHRIPAWYVYPLDKEGNVPAEIDQGRPGTGNEDAKQWVIARDEGEAIEKAKKKFGLEANQMKLERDEDVLDTWFSSGLFPFSCSGWPDTNRKDYQTFFPTSTLETGHDILFFWVARMVMMSLQLTNEIPFNQVLLHAMVRDSHGRKMSKSLGNVIDPLDVIEGVTLEELHAKLSQGNLDPREIDRAKAGQLADYPLGIAECGTDALRFALCAYTSQGKDVNLDINRVVGYRLFCNKLWNIMKFILFKLEAGFVPADEKPAAVSVADRWIESRLYAAVHEVHRGLENFELGAATTAIYEFWYYDIADHYLEVIKPVFFDNDDDDKESQEEARRVTRNVLYYCADMGLRLLHVFMPFLTEELWQRLPRRQGDPPSIMVARWPLLDLAVKEDIEAEQTLDKVKKVARGARIVRAEANLTALKKKLDAAILLNPGVSEVSTDALRMIAILGQTTTPKIVTEPVEGWAVATAEEVGTVYVNLAGAIDQDAEIRKLESRLKQITGQIQGLERQMSRDGYEKAPDKVKEKDNAKKVALEGEFATIQEAIEKFKK